MKEPRGLSCSVCYNAFTSGEDRSVPRNLNCGHTFCTACLQKIAAQSLHVYVKCPACKSETPLVGCSHSTGSISSLPKNFGVLEIIECSERKSSKSHGNASAVDNDKAKRNSICEEHDEAKKVYCYTDQCLICIYCQIYGKHQGHECELASENECNMEEPRGLSCSVCFNAFTSGDCRSVPCNLNCGHTFCTACLQKIAAQSLHEYVKCPACKSETPLVRCSHSTGSISSLPKNFGVLEIIECRERKSNNGHGNASAVDNDKAKSNSICEEHDEAKKVYCYTDQCLICIYCQIYGKHQGHECELAKKCDMEKHREDYDKKGQQLRAQEERRIKIQRCIQSLVHATHCRDANCTMMSCAKKKKALEHAKSCKRKTSGGCRICQELIHLCCYHAKRCMERECVVPFCRHIKNKLRQQQMQQRFNQARTLRRRIAQMQGSTMQPPA